MSKEHYLHNNWEFREQGSDTWYPAQVPGNVHVDLFTNKLIPDPFYRDNEQDLQYVDFKNWEYRLIFNQDTEEDRNRRHFILFEGLDTYASIYLNGKHLANSANMYTPLMLKLENPLKEQDNELLVQFASPVEVDLPKAQAASFMYPATNEASQLAGLGDTKISIFARKPAYQYGWDWGPRYLSCGIWKPVSIISMNEAFIHDVFIEQKEVNTSIARLQARLHIEASKEMSAVLSLCWVDGSLVQTIQLAKGDNEISLDIDIPSPRLWWCRGQGEQNRYQFTAEILSPETNCLLDSKTIRTGLRSVRLAQRADEWGTSFYIELNGRPVFMKGANHIPNDSFPGRIQPAILEREIKACADANFNMLRVWGGGYYEDDAFYTLCDEYGILIWQDFMFACSMYPGNTEFLESLEKEFKSNIIRLRNHPCIALWCGNNEMDSAWVQFIEGQGWGWKEKLSSDDRQALWDAYLFIFEDLIPRTLSELLPQASYWPSSPQRNLSLTADRHARGASNAGDVHYWGVWHQREPFENYHKNIGRFMSEYGFQSFPEMNSIRSFAEEEDLAIESKIMKAHQKSYIGNSAIMDYIEREYRKPDDFEEFVYLSQLVQAEGIRTAVEAHRQSRPFCMGTLVWQVNDCWPAPSWSSIDYEGRWKALHYFLRDSMADIALVVFREEAQLKISVCNDSPQAQGVRLEVLVLNFNGEKQFHKGINAMLAPASVSECFELSGLKFSVTDCFVDLSLYIGGKEIHRRTAFFRPVKDLQLPMPKPKIIGKRQIDGTLQFAITSEVFVKNFALFVSQAGTFSENYIDLLPNEERAIAFTPYEPLSGRVCRAEWRSIGAAGRVEVS